MGMQTAARDQDLLNENDANGSDIRQWRIERENSHMILRYHKGVQAFLLIRASDRNLTPMVKERREI